MIFPAIRLESPSRVVKRKKYFERWISDAVMIDNVLIMSVPKSGLLGAAGTATCSMVKYDGGGRIRSKGVQIISDVAMNGEK